MEELSGAARNLQRLIIGYQHFRASRISAAAEA